MITVKDYHSDSIDSIILTQKQFPGGEMLFNIKQKNDIPYLTLCVTLNYQDDKDLVALMMVKDAIARSSMFLDILEIPYFPGARQDRVCNPGEALSVKVYTDLINSLKIPEVIVFDPHSDVVSALLDNVKIIKNHKFAEQVLDDILNNGVNREDVLLVACDAGSNKKIFEISQLTGIPSIRADKLRDIATGKIIETIVYADDLKGKIMIVYDDICSYGGTFIALAKKLKEKGAEKVYLAVSHWEGVADLDKLKESGIEKVYTTNSRVFENPDKQITVFPWNQ